MNLDSIKHTNQTDKLFKQPPPLTNYLSGRGIKHRWVASELGISESLFCLMLQGKRNWQLCHVDRLQECLGLRRKQILIMIRR
jgi:hypothetical protein